MTGQWAFATVGRAHGLRGEFYLDLLPGGLDYLSRGSSFLIDRGGGRGRARGPRAGGGPPPPPPLARLEIATTVEEARALHGALLFAQADELDEGVEHYLVSELVGLRVVCGERELGEVREVLMNPAHDILEIGGEGHATVLVPLVEELVEIDREHGVVLVREGLL
jgi:ribosomal 30S subunit maturation factor RimM